MKKPGRYQEADYIEAGYIGAFIGILAGLIGAFLVYPTIKACQLKMARWALQSTISWFLAEWQVTGLPYFVPLGTFFGFLIGLCFNYWNLSNKRIIPPWFRRTIKLVMYGMLGGIFFGIFF